MSGHQSTAILRERLNDRVMGPLIHTSLRWLLWTALLLGLIGFGLWSYLQQFQQGLIVTGMRDTVIWGVYISNFVFFSGLSMAGTFISAILRITGAEWRRPLTRIAELTTVSALMMCGLNILVDIGRPDRLLHLFIYGRLQSPLLWDVIAISTYLVASIIYLYLFMIPDAALVRDRLKGKLPGWQHKIYSFLAMRWHGLPEQHKRLERGATIMMLLIIPIGVSVHSVVSWIFGMTFRAGWDTTIFAPYFAVGALFSGTAMLITLLIAFRRLYHLEDYITTKHFRYLSFLMIAFGIVYLYFTFAEYLTIGYKLEGEEGPLLQALFFGKYSLPVWFGFFGGQILPLMLVASHRTRTIPVLLAASILVNLGMWLKRFLIVVPSLSLPLLPYDWGIYSPTIVEIGISIGTFAGFLMIITLFSKVFPIVSIAEMEEGWEKQASPAPQPQPHSAPAESITETGATNPA